MMRRGVNSTTQGSGTISCTPHFKEDIDVDKSWVTADMGPTILSFYLHPKADMTLEEAVRKTETFSTAQFSNSLNTASLSSVTDPLGGQHSNMSTMDSQYIVTITSCVARGDNIERHKMSEQRAASVFHEGETLSFPYHYNFNLNMQVSRHTVKCVIL